MKEKDSAGFKKVERLLSIYPKTKKGLFFDSNPQRIYFLSILLFLVGLCSYQLLLGPVPDIIWGNEIPHEMDAAWRINQGQIPRIDYFHHAYELFHMVIAAFLFITGPSISAMTFTRLFFLLTLTLINWRLAASRFSAPWTFITTILTAILLSGYCPLSWTYQNVTHGEFFNRINWAILTTLLIYSFFRPLSEKVSSLVVDAILVGILFGALFLQKPTYLFEATVALCLGGYYRTVNHRQISLIISVFVLILLAYSFYIHWQWSVYLHSVLGLTKTVTLDFYVLLTKGLTTLPYLVVLPVIYLQLKTDGVDFFEIKRFIYFYLFVVLGGYALIVTNLPQYGDSIIYLVIPLLCLRYWNRMKASWAAVLMVAITGGWVANSLLTLPQALYVEQQLLGLEPAQRNRYTVNADAYRGWLSPSGGGPCLPEQWVTRLNEGLKLLRGNSGETDKIATLDFMNPFPFALQRPSPKGGYILLHYGLTVTEDYVPNAEEFFRDTDVVMIPSKCPENEASYVLSARYSNYLNKHYPVTVQGTFWTLRKRAG